MPLVILGKIEAAEPNGHFIQVPEIEKGYPHCADGQQSLVCTVTRIFNPEGKRVIAEPNTTFVFPIRKQREWYSSIGVVSDIYTVKAGVPVGSFVEIVVTNLNSGDETIPVYPNDMILKIDNNAPYELRARIEQDLQQLKNTAEAFEAIGLLYQARLPAPAQALHEGLVRLERGDHPGAIKHFRLNIEAQKKILENSHQVRDSDGKSEALGAFLTKAFHMLSAFGEHAGTSGLLEEALLARDVAVATSRYFASVARPRPKPELPRAIPVNR